MTRAKQLCFAEMDWRATQLHQAMRRIKRYTQTAGFVSMTFLCAAYSFDSVVADTAFTKFRNMERTLGL